MQWFSNTFSDVEGCLQINSPLEARGMTQGAPRCPGWREQRWGALAREFLGLHGAQREPLI